MTSTKHQIPVTKTSLRLIMRHPNFRAGLLMYVRA